MRIASAEVQMASSHASQQHHAIQESLRMWVGDRRPDFADDGQARPALQQAAERVTISDAGRTAQTGEAEAIKQASEAAENDPRLTLLRRMIEMLTGRQARVFDASEIAPRGNVEAPPATAEGAADRPAGYGVEYDYREVYSEVEQTAFSATGTVRTADGKEIAFTLQLSMSRSYYEESNVSLRLGDAARQQKDPLILDFTGSAGQLSDQRFSFDIDADGKADSINRLAPGTGFLALDRNGDGRINDGSELFGTRSGDGFADLAAYDDDGNGWIDEADPVYQQLRVWTPSADGTGRLQTLAELGVGAVQTAASATTPFALRTADNTPLGAVRSTSVYLREDGGVGTVQQIDLSV